MSQRDTAPDGGATPATGPEQTYFNYLVSGEWRIPRCQRCDKAVFYPRVACLACGNDTFDWVAPSGLGTIYSTTVMRRPAQAGGDLHLCLVDLDEGFRMMSRVQDKDPAAVRIGDRVRARLVGENEQTLVVFAPTEDQA
ncbi:Zn-ribbon domain-containing OB-fold protein [Bordetella flabilis]|uniref:DNA-binding protein n=1 Tax=Bordetella flabilis TaxID=463014 RepID=A0A193GE20_9BORD|nr:OB-fold domain-containing protein [Bordetella flabilis]ANN77696.1 DNA-binding protein [Bordetella flabilis]